MKNILKSGLEDVSISRNKEKLPWVFRPKMTRVMYAWFDALTNYITALGWESADDKLFQSIGPRTLTLSAKK